MKITVGAFATVLFITLSASIHLSSLGLNFGSLGFGSGKVWRGHPTTVRIAALDPVTTRFVDNIAAEMALVDANGVRMAATGAATSMLELDINVPADVVEPVRLHVRLEAFEESDIFDVPLMVVDTPGPMGVEFEPYTHALTRTDAGKPRTPRGPITVALFPWGGHVVRGLQNVVDGLVLRDGVPIATHIVCKSLKLDTTTNSLGHFRFHYTPHISPKPLAFFVGDAPSQKLEVPLDMLATQLRLEVEPRRFIKAGSEVFATVWALPFRDPIHVDVWSGDTLLLGDTDFAKNGVRQLTIPIPDDVQGWIRIEAYRNLVAPGMSVATDWLWVSAKAEAADVDEALQALEKAALEVGAKLKPALNAARKFEGEDRAALVGMAISRLSVEESGMPMRLSTLESRRAAIGAEVKRIRGHVHALFIFTALLGLALMATWVVRHTVTVRRNMLSVMHDGITAGESVDPEDVQKLGGFGHLYDLVMVFAALILIAYGSWVLLTRISWDYLGAG